MFEPLFASDDILAATSDEAWTAALLRFEGALALAEAATGVVPDDAARAIAAAAATLRVDPGSLAQGARGTGNPVVPLVRALTDALDPEAGRWVHFGATSQDAMDTAAMLVAEEAGRLVLTHVGAAADACAALAGSHRRTLMAGRTLLQQALPVTFGLKAAQWLVGLTEAGQRLDQVVAERLAVQLGGAAGTLASLGGDGPATAAALAARLGLADPPLPWHTDRARVAELAGALAAVATAAAKVAVDVVLLAQTEVGEVAEGGGAGHGGSSTLPHKANPVTSVTVLAAARRAHGAAAVLTAAGVHDHERAGTGGWHVEWQSLTDLLRAAGATAAGVARVVEGLSVDADRMAANLARTRGVLVAERVVLDLAPEIGRREAAELVGQASRRALAEDRPLGEVLASMPEIASRRSPEVLDQLCDPGGYLGANDVFIDRALALHLGWGRRDGGPGAASGGGRATAPRTPAHPESAAAGGPVSGRAEEREGR